MSDEHTQRAAALEQQVRAAILRLMQRGSSFKVDDVASAIKAEAGAVPLDRVGRLVRQVADAGLLGPFGFRRTLSRERTSLGVITVVAYAPRRTRPPVRRPSQRPLAEPELARPFAHLGLDYRAERRLGRQTDAIRAQLSNTARDMVRTGMLLSAARALVGSDLSGYVKSELGMSGDTARRLIRVAEVFSGHPALDALSVSRPSVLYKLAEPSFPPALREAVLAAGGLTVDGAQRRLEALRVADLQTAKKRFAERGRWMSELQRLLADAESKRDEAAARRVRAQLADLGRQPVTVVFSESGEERQARALSSLVRDAEKMAAALALGAASPEAREASAKALRSVLAELETDPDGSH